MYRKSSKGRTYYCCRTYYEKGKQFCAAHSIREDVLFDAVLEAINLEISMVGDMDELLRRAGTKPPRSEDTRVLDIKLLTAKQELQNETAVFDRTYYDFTGGVISREQFKRIRAICEKHQEELRALCEALSGEIERLTEARSAKPSVIEAFKKDMRAAELTRSLALALIDSVYVYGDKSVKVIFTFAGPGAV